MIILLKTVSVELHYETSVTESWCGLWVVAWLVETFKKSEIEPKSYERGLTSCSTIHGSLGGFRQLFKKDYLGPFLLFLSLRTMVLHLNKP